MEKRFPLEDEKSTSLKISNQERIERILDRICKLGLPVIIRAPKKLGTSVKGRATKVIGSAPGKFGTALRISNVSDRGMEFLAGSDQLQIEFVMMSTKVVFRASMLHSEDCQIVVSRPKVLTSIERRSDTRFKVESQYMAFLNLSKWRPRLENYAGPPLMPKFDGLKGYINVLDVSQGGICAEYRFPAIHHFLKRGMIDDYASLVLPMMEPINLSIEVRWIKRLKELVSTDGIETSYRNIIRFGCQFETDNQEIRNAITMLIRNIAQSSAI